MQRQKNLLDRKSFPMETDIILLVHSQIKIIKQFMEKTKIIEDTCMMLSNELCKTVSMPLIVISQNDKGETSLLVTNSDITTDHVIQFMQGFIEQLEKQKSTILLPGAAKIIQL